MNSPAVICPQLPAFNWNNLDSICRAFDGLIKIPMRQAWLPAEEPGFAPASVQVGWRDEHLFVFAELTDADISTRATRHNERMWELGDVFEMFLRPDGQEAYTELHVAPNNLRLQLRFADANALEYLRQTRSLERALIHGQIFDSIVWLQPENQRWFVLAKIPATSICEKPAPMLGSTWHFSFSRYDYTRGHSKPVIYSTSPHLEPRFHRQQEWGKMQFK